MNVTSAIPDEVVTANVTGFILTEVWYKLDLAWEEWNTMAGENPLMIIWDKATWKKWI